MKILFLDQSGNLGGAELCLSDIAKHYQISCLVGLFADGPFRALLEQQQIPVQVLSQKVIQIRKDSNWMQGISNANSLIPLILNVATIARCYDLIYANTQKALVIGALASLLSNRPLVYHLHDILSADHFSSMNRRVAVTLANRFAKLVIANSNATQNAFLEAGGRHDITHVVYNGFDLDYYHSIAPNDREQIRRELGWGDRFIVGHFSRLSPWKGQHILLDALVHCSSTVVAIIVGDALFGEHEYANSLRQQVTDLGLQDRVRFLGFRSDVVQLMSACDLVAHTSTAPEPFGRVIVEAMLCSRPVVASNAGGATELIEPHKTGWLFPPGNAQQLAEVITSAQQNPVERQSLAEAAQIQSAQRFSLTRTNQHLAQLLNRVVSQA